MSDEDFSFDSTPPPIGSGNGSAELLDGCLSGEDCRAICEGALGEEDTLRWMGHVAGCSRCATTLREYAQVFREEVSPEEAVILGQLPSSSAQGIANLAVRMSGVRGEVPQRWWQRTRSWWLMPAVGLATACVAFAAWFGVTRMGSRGDVRLMAAAYDAARPSELRIPESTPGDVASTTRGTNPDGASSTALLEWKLRVQQRFEKTPNDAATRREMGQIALVERDPRRALEDFEMAGVLDPKLPRLNFDLGTAHFELAEATDQQLEFERAIECFSQYLQQENANDPVALFDRALAWEHVGASGRAIADLQAALAHEKDAAWRRVLEEHLRRLQGAGGAGPQAKQDPGGRAGSGAPSSSLDSGLGAGYEASSDVAMRQWLPQRDHADAARLAALETLAQAGRAHGDTWLVEMLQHPANAAEISAEQALAASLEAYDRGDLDETLRQARQAQELFRAAHNEAGLARADLQAVYALQANGKALPCLDEANRLGQRAAIATYPRIQVQLWLELSACDNMSGDAERGLGRAQQALLAAHLHALPTAGLRAAGFLLINQFGLGRLEAAARTGSEALHLPVAGPAAFVQRFQLLNDMEDIARRCELPAVVRGFSEEAAELASRTKNARAYAYALEDLGAAQLEDGDAAAARQSFAQADKQLAAIPDGPAQRLYRADWQTDRAALIARSDGLPAALRAVAGGEPQFEHFAMVVPRARFYTEYAELLRQQGDMAGSMAKANQAIASLDQSLAKLVDPAARKAWLARNPRPYQLLIADLVDAGATPQALAAWQRMRSAPFEAGPIALAANDLAPGSLPARTWVSNEPGTLRLAYGRLEDRYVVWAWRDGGQVQARTLGVSPATLETTAHIFASLCADPESSRADLQEVGRRLSSMLLGPVQQEIDRSGTVDLAVDDPLLELPFAAIPSGGSYLGLLHPLRMEQPAPQRASIAPMETAGLQHVLLLRGAGEGSLPKAWDETASLAAQFPSAAVEGVRLEREDGAVALAGGRGLSTELRSAEVLHYSGHGLEEDASGTTPAGSSLVALAPGSLPRCRLAVLAACRTLGEREQDVDRVSSVAGVMLRAGAENVIATRWDVDSRVTRELMLTFYRQLAAARAPEDSLQAAMKSAEREPSTAHPYFWAAFQLVHSSAIPNPRSSSP